MAETIRVLIADDDPMFLDALEALFERADDIGVAGRAENGDKALRLTAELMPDVITMDIDMPIVDGVEATRMIVHYFHVPVVILTGSEAGDRAGEALSAGAVGYVVKSRAWEDLLPTIRAAAARRPRH